MKLKQPFYRLPLRFDAARLATEVAQFAEHEWQRHPTGYAGNSAIRLISAEGGENDRTVGRMAGTAALARMPYVRQVLDRFGVVWSRSRLMRLAPGAEVPEHADINYHWYHRVRIHIPVVTAPAVRFRCDGRDVHMAAGEAWLFDNWRRHSVHNGADLHRVHLVADTTGSAPFWEAAAQAADTDLHAAASTTEFVAFDPGREPSLLFERHNSAVVLPPAEIEQLVGDLAADLAAPSDERAREGLRIFRILLDGFCREWRLVWSLYADAAEGWPHYARLRDYLRGELAKMPSLRCESNGMDAFDVLRARVLAYALNPEQRVAADDRDRTLGAAASAGGSAASEASKTPGMAAEGDHPNSPSFPRTRESISPSDAQPPEEWMPAPVRAGGRLSAGMTAARGSTRAPLNLPRPVFIVAAPRSGSTLLFETLAKARDFITVGGEAPGLAERLPQLRPGAPGVDSNRLDASQVDATVRAHVDAFLREKLRDRDGTPVDLAAPLRWLEKTPRNALRIPFLDTLFPDARFVFLWRDPRENLGSILDAWADGGWITYPELPGWNGPWSLLLPPGWQALRGRPPAEVAAFQWATTQTVVLDDLATLAPERWTALSYADFLADSPGCVRRLCDFAGVAFDDGLAAHLAAPLPLSRHTLAPPRPDKWRRHATAIDAVMPSLANVVTRLETLPRG